MASYRMALSCWADPGKCRRICGVDSPGSILRFQVGFIFTISVFWGANLWIMNPNANSEAFYAGSLTRISNSMIVLAVLFTVGSWILYGGRIAVGVPCGWAIAYVNFFWLKRVVTALADRATEASQPQSNKGGGLGFLLRYLFMAVAAYFF